MPQPQPSTGAWAVMGPARKVSLHMQGQSHQGRHGYMHESSQHIHTFVHIAVWSKCRDMLFQVEPRGELEVQRLGHHISGAPS